MVTERTREKGERDLLVALGWLILASPDDLDEFVSAFETLGPEWRHAVVSNLTLVSLIAPRAGMPDPTSRRAHVAEVVARLLPLVEDRRS